MERFWAAPSRFAWFAAFWGACLQVSGLPAAGLAGQTYSAAPGAGSNEVVYVGPASEELRRDAANIMISDGLVWEKANSLFQGIVRRDTTRFGAYQPRGWEGPDLSDENRRGTVDSLQEAFAREVHKTRAKEKDVPSPCDSLCQQSLRDALAMGETLRRGGKVRFDGEGGQKYLPSGPGVMGAFVYEPARAIGVFYSQYLSLIARYVGDTIAAATVAHEFGHADDHSKGQLDPKRVKEGETKAFKREYEYLIRFDPKGQILAKLRYNFVRKPWVPAIVSDYLEHLAKVRLYGDKGDFDGLVESLGYQDPHRHPSRHHPGDGHDHPKG